MTLYLILLKIPKYLINDLPKHSTCSSNRKVSSRVKPKYWNDLTLLIVISLVTISPICFGIGLFIAWNSMKLVLSQFIVNLFLTHHKYNSLNFDTTFAIRLFKFSSYMKGTYRLQIAWYNLAPLHGIYHLYIMKKSVDLILILVVPHILHHQYRIQQH